MPNYENDDELIQAIRGGDPFQSHAVIWILKQDKWRNAPVYQIRKLQMKLDLKNEVFYESLSELVLNVIKGDFKGNSTLIYYFEMICRYNLLNRLTRKVKDSNYLVTNEIAEIIENEVRSQLTSEESDRQEDIQELIRSLIEKVNERCQYILSHLILGYSLKEIADRLSVQYQTVKNDVAECRKKIRDLTKNNDYLMNKIKSLIG